MSDLPPCSSILICCKTQYDDMQAKLKTGAGRAQGGQSFKGKLEGGAQG
jgi:hypothetical protein